MSHHLALLRVAGIIECRRDGKHNFYRLVPKRCQAFLDTVFGVAGHETRKLAWKTRCSRMSAMDG